MNYLYVIFKPVFKFLVKIIFRPKILGQENIPKEGPIILQGIVGTKNKLGVIPSGSGNDTYRTIKW